MSPSLNHMLLLLLLLAWLMTMGYRVADAHGDGALGINHCATPDVHPSLANRIMDISKKKKQNNVGVHSKALPSMVTIDTYFCIVVDQFGVGDVNDTVVNNQITVLNESFADSGSRFRFVLKHTTRARQAGLSYSALKKLPLQNYIDKLALSCHQGRYDALNFFIVPNIQSSSTGFVLGMCKSYFATGVGHLDGVYLIPNVLPGGGLHLYNHGFTAVHETGHWFGLIHTFQANPPYKNDPCNPSNPNDYIADTPQMKKYSGGCPVHRNSCPLLPGLDPTDNFMNYGQDYNSQGRLCRTRFTPQQVARMDDVWELYRLQNDICALDEFQFQLQLRFDQTPQYLSWDIQFPNGTKVHQSVTDGLGHKFDANFTGQTITNYHCFPRRQKYMFTMYSSIGHGIQSPGYFIIYINGKLYAQGGQDFTKSKRITFGVGLAPVSPHRRPTTRKPTR